MEVRSFEAIVSALSVARVDYLVVGGLAVIAHGYERLTNDVDLVIGLDPGNVSRGLHALECIGYKPVIPVTAEEFANVTRREEWRRDKNMVVLRLWSDAHQRTPVDVFVYEPFDFRRELRSAIWADIGGGLKAPILKFDSLIAMKRATGRLQDMADVAALLEIHGDGGGTGE
jgi:hypothetical protein